MTTATLDRAANPRAEGHYGFRTVAQMEWLKLRSVRSTWWTLLVFAAGMVGLAILVIHQHWAHVSSRPRVLRPDQRQLRRAGDRPARRRRPRRAGGDQRVLLRHDPRHVRRGPAPPAGAGRQGGDRRRGDAGGGGDPGLRRVRRRRGGAQEPGPARHPRPAGRAARGADGRRLPGPDRAHRPWPGRPHPAHRGRDQRRGRGAVRAAADPGPARDLDPELGRAVHADADRGELADRGQAGGAQPVARRRVRGAVLYAAAALAVGGWALARRDA